MIFCGTELARRIERAECALVASGTAAVARRVGADEAFVMPVAGGLAAFSGLDSPLTKVVGVGFDGGGLGADLEAVEATFAARAAVPQIELASLAEAGIAAQLTRRGYVLVGFEDVLGRPLAAEEAPARAADVEIVECGPGELETWLRVLVDGFATPDAQGVASHESFPREALARVMRDFAGTEGSLRFLARRGGQPAGGGGLHLVDGLAQLTGAATLPAHRRRGVQGALLAHRLRIAAARGCDLAVVTTLPGSKSQENALRRGFERLYTRAILRREGG